MHFQVAQLNSKIRKRVVYVTIRGAEIGSWNGKIPGKIDIEYLIARTYLHLLRVESADNRVFTSVSEVKLSGNDNSCWKFTFLTPVVDFVSKEIEQCVNSFMLEVGNHDEGELVKETFNFGDHKIL